MERKFIIENQEVCIPSEQVKMFYRIFDDCYHDHTEVLQKYENDLYVNDEGKVIDCQDCAKVMGSKVYNEEGLVIEMHDDYFTFEKAEGFIYNNRLYLIEMLEEVH